MYHFGVDVAKAYFLKFDKRLNGLLTSETYIAMYEILAVECDVMLRAGTSLGESLWGHWTDDKDLEKTCPRRNAAFWFAKGVSSVWQPNFPVDPGTTRPSTVVMSPKQFVLWELLDFLDGRFDPFVKTASGFLHLDLVRP